MKIRRLFFWISLCLLGITILHPCEIQAASEPSSEDKRYQIQMKLGLGHGYESNVFFSENNPQSDTFTLSEAILNAVVKPTSRSYLFADFLGSHQHFWDFHRADRVFMDMALDYQHFIIPSRLAIGLSNTLSYADLKLFDTEGNALPREKFGSLSERVRFYGLFYPSQSFDLEMGGSYRIMDVEETEDRPPYNLPSLDFKEFAADVASRYFFTPRLSTRVKYEYSTLSYDELQSYNRDTSFNGVASLGNPRLRLRRHEVAWNFKYKRSPALDLEFTGKLRMNDDRFEDDLDYRQEELKTRAILGDSDILSLWIELYYKNRYYTDRRKGIGFDETLKEEFLIAATYLTRNLTHWLQAYLKYQWLHKTSNASTSEFNDHIGMLGFRLIL